MTPVGGWQNPIHWPRTFSCQRSGSVKPMKIEVFADDESAARAAAGMVAEEARAAVAARGRFVLAVSGGRTPWIMMRALTGEDVPWESVHVVQVDERVAPAGDPDRNLTHLRESLLDRTPIRPEQIHAMPVESPDLEEQRPAIRRDAGAKSLARRRRSTWFTWVSGRTGIQPLWCLEIR